MIMAKLLVFLFVTLLVAAPVRAAPCRGDFNGFLAAMARDAQGQGISRDVIDTAFASVTPDPAVLAFDRRQHGTFRQSFERYAATRVTAPRIKRAKILMQRDAALLSRVEQQFGVRITGSLPISPVPLSVSMVQIAISSVAGTPA